MTVWCRGPGPAQSGQSGLTGPLELSLVFSSRAHTAQPVDSIGQEVTRYYQQDWSIGQEVTRPYQWA